MSKNKLLVVTVGALCLWFFYLVGSGGGSNASAPSVSSPTVVQAPQAKIDPANELKSEISARKEYARILENHLLSIGIDATVRASGSDQTTLRISWAAMGRPTVYNMMNSEGMRTEVPSLGFVKIIMTDDGGFSGDETPETWTYHRKSNDWVQ